MKTPQQFLLFDGGLLQKNSDLLNHTKQLAIFSAYQQYGEEAKWLGPLVIPSNPISQQLLADLEKAGTPLSYSFARLSVKDCFTAEQLFNHLTNIHTLTLESGKEFYLRYADARVFNSLYKLLNPRQINQLFGGIAKWEVPDRELNLQQYAPSNQNALNQRQSNEGLKLNRAQFTLLNKLGEPDLIIATLHEQSFIDEKTASQYQTWQKTKLALEKLGQLKQPRYQDDQVKLRICDAAIKDSGILDGNLDFFNAANTIAEGNST